MSMLSYVDLEELKIWREIKKWFLIFRQLLLQFREADISNLTSNMKVYCSSSQPYLNCLRSCDSLTIKSFTEAFILKLLFTLWGL